VAWKNADLPQQIARIPVDPLADGLTILSPVTSVTLQGVTSRLLSLQHENVALTAT